MLPQYSVLSIVFNLISMEGKFIKRVFFQGQGQESSLVKNKKLMCTNSNTLDLFPVHNILVHRNVHASLNVLDSVKKVLYNRCR